MTSSVPTSKSWRPMSQLAKRDVLFPNSENMPSSDPFRDLARGNGRTKLNWSTLKHTPVTLVLEVERIIKYTFPPLDVVLFDNWHGQQSISGWFDVHLEIGARLRDPATQTNVPISGWFPRTRLQMLVMKQHERAVYSNVSSDRLWRWSCFRYWPFSQNRKDVKTIAL
jgi:hypothetical protein